jgi:hypothetical protein
MTALAVARAKLKLNVNDLASLSLEDLGSAYLKLGARFSAAVEEGTQLKLEVQSLQVCCLCFQASRPSSWATQHGDGLAGSRALAQLMWSFLTLFAERLDPAAGHAPARA